jgi:hypothetical protein
VLGCPFRPGARRGAGPRSGRGHGQERTSGGRCRHAPAMASDDDVTPEQLATELGYSGRTIRAFLREQHGKLTPPERRWLLTPEQVAEVRARFPRRG